MQHHTQVTILQELMRQLDARNGVKSLSKKLGTSQIERMGKGWVVLG